MKHKLLKLLHLVVISATFCSLSYADNYELRGKRISSADGLLCNAVNEMVQDNYGYIWMGTTNGLCRYDGYNFVNFTSLSSDPKRKTDSHIGRLYINNKTDLLWVRTSTYIQTCYDIRKAKFVDYTGCGDNFRNYYNNFVSSMGMWMFSSKFGVRLITYKDGKFNKIDYTKENGSLPSNNVKTIKEDRYHSVWIVTDHGFSMVDQQGKARIIDNKSNILTCKSSKGENFFFTSDNTVLIYNHEGKLIKRYAPPSTLGPFNDIAASFVWNNKWVIFTKNTTYTMDVSTGAFSIPADMQIKNAVEQQGVSGYKFVSNESGNLWIFSNKWKRVLKLIYDATYTNNKIHKFSIAKDKNGILYIATYGNGMFVYNPVNNDLKHYTAEDANPLIYSNYLLCVMIDKAGNIWTGSEVAGASCITKFKGATAKYVLPEPDRRGDWSNNIIRIAKQPDKSILICTRANKIYRYNPNDGSVTFLKEMKACVRAFITDRNGHTWIGTYGDGIFVDNRHYCTDDKKFNIPYNIIYDICCDKYGRIWIATWGGGILMTQYNNGKPMKFRRFLNRNVNESDVHDLELGSNGDLWIATNNGLYLLDTNKKNLTDKSFKNYCTENGKFPNNELLCLHYSKKGKLWVGTPGKGIIECTYNASDGEIAYKELTTKQGLINNNVNSIIEDSEGNVWTGTEEGVSTINANNSIVSNLFSTLLQSNAFTEKCAILSDDGKLLMGTSYGMAVVTPNNNKDNKENLKTRITDLTINGISIYETNNAENDLQEDISVTKKIVLDYNENSLSIFYSNFNYSNIHSALYTFYLEGFEKSWLPLTSVNHADYNNLNPGHYVFHLRSLNSDKDETTLIIIIREPWYNTWSAWSIYIIIIVSISFVIYRNWRKNFELSQQMKVEKEVSDFRQNFFTHIAHEFRTPLAIIQGAIDKLSQGDAATSKAALQTARRGTRRMLRLVNQFMEYRRLNSGSMPLSIEKSDIIDFIRKIYQDFWDMSKQKEIQITFTPFEKKYEMFFDKYIVESMVYNILSNAVKYTPMKGSVQLTVKLDNDNKSIIISCEDSGAGIADRQTDELFKPFMHGYVSQGGMGIGLYTAHQMAIVHKGSLTYRRATDEGGSIFIITLPTDENVYSPDDYNNIKAIEISNKEEEKTEEIIRELKPNAYNDITIAIIEDDPDMMEQIKTEMSVYFNVECFMDGKSGYEWVIKEKPSLVICDVMLPDINGYDVVKKIKKEISAFKIPVIMLTALDDDTHQIKGYEAGADDYMVKPCNFRVLIARATQLIQWSRRLANAPTQAMENNGSDNSDSIVTSRADKNFKDNVQTIVYQHIGDPDFNIDQLASMLSMGRTKFYGKMKELSGVSPNKYLSNERMRIAAELLLEGEMNVAEVSYKVGFQDTSYFNKCFKAKYGVVPSKYGKDNANV